MGGLIYILYLRNFKKIWEEMGWMIWICILRVLVRLLDTLFQLGCGSWWFGSGSGGGGIEREYHPLNVFIHFTFREKTNSGDLVVVSSPNLVVIIIITFYPFSPHHDVGR